MCPTSSKAHLIINHKQLALSIIDKKSLAQTLGRRPAGRVDQRAPGQGALPCTLVLSRVQHGVVLRRAVDVHGLLDLAVLTTDDYRAGHRLRRVSVLLLKKQKLL